MCFVPAEVSLIYLFILLKHLYTTKHFLHATKRIGAVHSKTKNNKTKNIDNEKHNP